MKQGSLDQVIGDMVRRLGTAHSGNRSRRQNASSEAVSGIEELAPADPVLSHLHKQYLEANQSYKKLIRENGFGDPMAEVASDFLDSARSAVQTRLLELQALRDTEVYEEMRRRVKARKAQQEARDARAFFEARRKEEGDDLFFWFVMLYWLVNRTFSVARKRLSAANDFALVAVAGETRCYMSS